jgi:CheY-like chemotaxis protein
VDDDDDNREGFAEYFTYLGCRVQQAASGAEALEAARRTRPDAIIIDLAMPQMDGWDLIGRLRRDERTGATPLLVVSACVFPDERERAIAAGCDGFLPKPCAPDEVYAEVLRLIGEEPRGRD